MTTETLLLSFVTAVCAFVFIRVIKLEFEVSKLNRLVDYLMDRGHQ